MPPTRAVLGCAALLMLTAAAPARALEAQVVQAPDGSNVNVEFSDRWTADERPSAQAYADFLGALPHGPELQDLTIRLARGIEKTGPGFCGHAANGCYLASEGVIVVGALANSTVVDGPRSLTHEYGHRIADQRPAYVSARAFPLGGAKLGAPYWASYERICAAVEAGGPAPAGRQPAGTYAQIPGENFADAYRRLTIPGEPWALEPTLEPDAGALAAIRKDIASPWQGPKATTYKGWFTGKTPSRTFNLVATLDGPLTARLS